MNLFYKYLLTGLLFCGLIFLPAPAIGNQIDRSATTSQDVLTSHVQTSQLGISLKEMDRTKRSKKEKQSKRKGFFLEVPVALLLGALVGIVLPVLVLFTIGTPMLSIILVALVLANIYLLLSGIMWLTYRPRRLRKKGGKIWVFIASIFALFGTIVSGIIALGVLVWDLEDYF